VSAESGAGVSWNRGLSTNSAAIVVLGVAGFGTNLVVASLWGPEGLGVFAQTLTWFIMAAQLATLGVHYAVLQRVAGVHDEAAARAVVAAGIRAVLPLSLAVALASAMGASLVGAGLRSEPTGNSIRLVSFALVLHALTKVVTAGLNGRGKMHRFGLVTIGRAFGLLIGTAALASLDAPSSQLGIIVISSEVMALVVALLVTGRLPVQRTPESRRDLLIFGVRSASAAIAAEANTRVDIAMLGVLSDDRTVGTYAIAAAVYEGLAQLVVMLRNQVNGYVAGALADGRADDVTHLYRGLRTKILGGAAALGLASVIGFAPALHLAGLPPSFVASRIPLLVLLSALTIGASRIPFDQVLILGNCPAEHTKIVVQSLAVNIATNVLLIPPLGALGAALGTAISLLYLLNRISRGARVLLGVNLSVNE
jgi:O-antigen/teichoic acid export membrane protein